MSYAANTSVAVERSQREIETMVKRAGATSFYRGELEERAVVGFQLKDRKILFELPAVQPEEVSTVERRGRRVKFPPHQVEQQLEQATRSRWRALALCIKAKLVSVESGVESFEEAFLAHIVVPHESGAKRFAAVAVAAIGDAYRSGKPMPPMLGPGGEP